MQNLSEVIRELMERCDLTGCQLAEDISLSEASVSRIVTGQSRPRQVTLSRLMKRLCSSPEEEQWLISAYEAKTAAVLPFALPREAQGNSRIEEERVRRYMEVKAQSIAFKRSVARELDKASLDYRQDVLENQVVADFLVQMGGKRVALECEFNLHRDVEKSVFSARLIREQFGCKLVFIVVPFPDEVTEAKISNENGIRVLALSDLAKEFNLVYNA